MDSPTTIIHVRKYRPLDVGFPAPGVYSGKIIVVLPSPDPTILSRFNPGGSEPPTLELESAQPVGAGDIMLFLQKSIVELEKISQGLASPVNAGLLNHIVISTRKRKDYGNSKIEYIDPEAIL